MTPCRPAYSPISPRMLSHALGGYLRDFAWDHFATLTYRKKPLVEAVCRDFEHGWIRRLAWFTRRSVPYFYVIEPTTVGWPHIHALTAATADLSLECMERGWKSGFTRIARYRRDERGAALYVTKALDRAMWWDFSDRRPPLLIG